MYEECFSSPKYLAHFPCMLHSTPNVNCTHKFGHSYFDETETSSLSSKKKHIKRKISPCIWPSYKAELKIKYVPIVMGLLSYFSRYWVWRINYLCKDSRLATKRFDLDRLPNFLRYGVPPARNWCAGAPLFITRVFDYLIFCLKLLLKAFFTKCHCHLLRETVMLMLIGNRSSYRPILSVMIFVINKSDSSLRFCQYSYDYKPNLNTINNKNSYFCRLSIKLL